MLGNIQTLTVKTPPGLFSYDYSGTLTPLNNVEGENPNVHVLTDI